MTRTTRSCIAALVETQSTANCAKDESCTKFELAHTHTHTHSLTHTLTQAPPPTAPTAQSTLSEAEFFAAAGFDDILYAVPISPDKLPQAADLTGRLDRFHVMIDNIAQLGPCATITCTVHTRPLNTSYHVVPLAMPFTIAVCFVPWPVRANITGTRRSLVREEFSTNAVRFPVIVDAFLICKWKWLYAWNHRR